MKRLCKQCSDISNLKVYTCMYMYVHACAKVKLIMWSIILPAVVKCVIVASPGFVKVR